MRFISWLVFLSIGAVIAAGLTANNYGHVTLYWASYRIDLSMNLFMILTFGLFVVVFLLLRLFAGIVSLPQRAALYRRTQRESRAIHAVTDAINHLFAGRFAKALKGATVATHFSGVSDIAALIAASASHRLKRIEERDLWLSQVKGEAYQQSRLVMMAEMQIDARDAAGALETIEKLQENGARQFSVQTVALKAHQLLGHWDEVIRLTQSLAKRKILHPLIARSRIQEALFHLAQSKTATPESLRKYWKNISDEDRQSVSIAKIFAQGFLNLGDYSQAKSVLDHVLDKQLSPELLEMYPDCASTSNDQKTNSLPLIQKVESWLAKNPAEPALHFALGRLCIQQKLWGKAKSSLSQVIRNPRASKSMEAQAHLSLAKIHEGLEESVAAAVHYKAAVELLV